MPVFKALKGMYDISISCENIFIVVFRLGNLQCTRWRTARDVCYRYRFNAAFALEVFCHNGTPPLCIISTVTRQILMTVLEVNADGFWMNINLVQKREYYLFVSVSSVGRWNETSVLYPTWVGQKGSRITKKSDNAEIYRKTEYPCFRLVFMKLVEQGG